MKFEDLLRIIFTICVTLSFIVLLIIGVLGYLASLDSLGAGVVMGIIGTLLMMAVFWAMSAISQHMSYKHQRKMQMIDNQEDMQNALLMSKLARENQRVLNDQFRASNLLAAQSQSTANEPMGYEIDMSILDGLGEEL